MRADITRDDASLLRPYLPYCSVILFVDGLPFLAFSLFFTSLRLPFSLPRVPHQSSLSLSGVWCYYQTPRQAVRWNRGESIDLKRRFAWSTPSERLSSESSALQVLDFIARHFVLLDYGRVGRFEFSIREILLAARTLRSQQFQNLADRLERVHLNFA